MSNDGAGKRAIGDAHLGLVYQLRQLRQRHTHVRNHRLVIRKLAHRTPQTLLAELPKLFRLLFAGRCVDGGAAVLARNGCNHISLFGHSLGGDAGQLIQQRRALWPRPLWVIGVGLVDDFYHFVVEELAAPYCDATVQRVPGHHCGILHPAGKRNTHRMGHLGNAMQLQCNLRDDSQRAFGADK